MNSRTKPNLSNFYFSNQFYFTIQSYYKQFPINYLKDEKRPNVKVFTLIAIDIFLNYARYKTTAHRSYSNCNETNDSMPHYFGKELLL